VRFGDTAQPGRAPQGRTRPAALLDEHDLGLSVQVLAELYVQATRPGRPDALDHAQGARLVESFTRFSVQPMTTAIVLAALATRGGVSAHSPFLGD